MTRTQIAKKILLMTIDELAAFMNVGWPGDDWYLDESDGYLWGHAFTQGTGKELFQPTQPGTIVNLYDFEAVVRWQGYGPDPTRGRGHRLSDLVVRWRGTSRYRVVIAWVPKDKVTAATQSLESLGFSWSVPGDSLTSDGRRSEKRLPSDLRSVSDSLDGTTPIREISVTATHNDGPGFLSDSAAR